IDSFQSAPPLVETISRNGNQKMNGNQCKEWKPKVSVSGLLSSARLSRADSGRIPPHPLEVIAHSETFLVGNTAPVCRNSAPEVFSKPATDSVSIQFLLKERTRNWVNDHSGCRKRPGGDRRPGHESQPQAGRPRRGIQPLPASRRAAFRPPDPRRRLWQGRV